MTVITAGHVHHALASIPIVDTSASLVVNLRDLEKKLTSRDNRLAVERALNCLLFMTHGLTVKLYEPFVRYDDEIYAFKNIDDQEVLSFFTAPGDRPLTRIFLHTYPALLDREFLAPERFHFCHLGSALDCDRRFEKAAALLSQGATADMGLFGPEGILKVGLCAPEGGQTDIRFSLGFYRPLCIGRGDLPKDGVADRVLRLALGHSRVLAFSTDMPNHGGLGSYPALFSCLMNPRTQCHGELTKGSDEGYSIQDFVRVTRQIPAQILNLPEKGHLGEGAVGDIAVYDFQSGSRDLASCLKSCAYLIKGGTVVVDRFNIVRDDVEKRSYFSGSAENDLGLAREVCRFSSLRFENLRVDGMLTGKAEYVPPLGSQSLVS
jgi:formylmethanofuran dehydrogenase subunit A